MSPIKIRQVLAGLAIFAALATFAPAHAAPPIQIPVQILDPDGACDSWTTGGTVLAPTITCVKAAGGTPAPGVPVCSITANDVNPLNLAASALVTLKATCTNTDFNTSYAWTGGNTTSPTSASTQSLQVGATTTFTVVATNASGPSASRSVTVNVNPTAPPAPPPPSGALSCPGYANTVVVDFAWTPKTQVLKSVSTGFGNSDIVVARFTTPANLTSYGAYGYVSFVEYGGFSSERTAVLSTRECDFSVAADSTHGYWTNGKVGTSGTVSFTSNINAGVALQPNTTYYFNINNMYFGAPKCGFSTCPIGVTLKTN